MKRRRVKITGIGPVTPAGIGRESFWRGILEPVSRVRVAAAIPPEDGTFVAAEVPDFRLERHVPGVSGKRMARHTQLAVAAAQLALQDAGLSLAAMRGVNPLVVVGASLMDFGAINRGMDMIMQAGRMTGIPASVFSASVSTIGGTLGEMIGGTPRVMALQSACCSGLDAIGHAMQRIAEGEAELAICGGTEAPLYLHPMLELCMAGFSPENPENPQAQCRPFDRWRTTGVIGEGACLLVLEPEESPRPGYAFVDGYAFVSDPVGALAEGLRESIRLALANARLRPAEIESVSAWGPGHRAVDAAEARALREIFGAGLADLPVTSIKGAIGNPLGAAGAIQTAAAALGLRDAMLPPTVNWKYPDPACALNLSAQPRHVTHRTALINSHGLSGTNACLVLAA